MRVFSRILTGVILAALANQSPAETKSAPTQEPSPQEIMGFAQLLEMAHYSRAHVAVADATKNVVAAMMQQLDPDRMVFVAGDVTALSQAAATRGGVYQLVRFRGNVSTGDEIYDRYRTRWAQCVDMIQKLLAGELNLSGDYDRASKLSTWPERLDESAWAARLRWELNMATLADTDDASARAHLRAHYATLLKNIRSVTPTQITELYLDAYANQYDRRTTYFSRQTYEGFSDVMHRVVGIGLQFKTVGNACIVESVMPEGPSAGQIFAHDRILGIGSTPSSLLDVAALPDEAIARLTRGNAGTPVTLQVVGNEVAATPMPRMISVERGAVDPNVNRARAAIFEYPTAGDHTSKLGVIRLASLYGTLDERSDTGASKDVAMALRNFAGAKVAGVVLDLRHNGGGYLTEAIDVAGCFLRRKVILTTRNYNGELNEDESGAHGFTYDGPLVVLVDSSTSSGAEIIAGALQDYGRAVVVGEHATRGVGTVQQVVMMNQILPAMHHAPSGAAKFTIQQFYLPSGRTTQQQGIVPDIVIHGIDDPLDEPQPETGSNIPSAIPAVNGAPRQYDPASLSDLRANSAERQKTLLEFAWLRRRQQALESRIVPLAPVAWRSFIRARADTRAALNAEQRQFAATAFHFSPVLLPGQSKAPQPPTPADPDRIQPTEYDDFRRFDVPLREALRIVAEMSPKGERTKP